VSPTGCGSGNFVRPTGTFVSIPDKFGWPWMPETNSWVCLLRFLCSPSNNGFHLMGLHKPTSGSSLVSRCCSIAFAQAEGWNAGNGVVYGVPLAPHPDATAIGPGCPRYSDIESNCSTKSRLARNTPVLNTVSAVELGLGSHRASIAPAVHPGATLSSVAIDRGKQDRRCRDSRRRCACS